jgi:hypothetical protein
MYKIVAENDNGGRPEAAPRFTVTVGLQEGYGDNGRIHEPGEAAALIADFLKGKAVAGEPFLTGSVSANHVVYAWGGDEPGCGSEPQIEYSGNKNPLYNSQMSDEDIWEFLDELAAHLGAALGQTRVYVEYDGALEVLQAEGQSTPTDD